jgi:hypothetical protein
MLGFDGYFRAAERGRKRGEINNMSKERARHLPVLDALGELVLFFLLVVLL